MNTTELKQALQPLRTSKDKGLSKLKRGELLECWKQWIARPYAIVINDNEDDDEVQDDDINEGVMNTLVSAPESGPNVQQVDRKIAI